MEVHLDITHFIIYEGDKSDCLWYEVIFSVESRASKSESKN